jgi:hypothetical protein
MSAPRVCILGNSVPLLIQPFRASSHEKTYGEHLAAKEFVVINSSKQSAMVSDLYYYLEDECIRQFPDYVIFHFGIVECTYRARPRWLQNFFSMNAWNNSVISKGYNGPLVRGGKFLVKKLYRKTLEKVLYALGIKRRWVGPEKFRFIITDVFKRIFSDTPVKRIIVVGMPPIADWMEKHIPGTQVSITEYNTILKDICTLYPNIVYVDTHHAFQQKGDYDKLTQDGIHFTAAGHAFFSDQLLPLLTGERRQFTDWQHINQYGKLYNFYEHWYKRKTPGK